MKQIGSLSKLTFVVALLTISIQGNPAQAQNSVRSCLYVPGVSVPAQMPADLLNAPTATPFPTNTPPAPTSVDRATSDAEENTFHGLWNAVNDHYVYTDFLGHDWNAIGERYDALIQQGLSEDAFYAAMQAMISELGDNHSYFQSPQEIEAEKAAVASRYDFVGIGALFLPIQDHATVMTLFPDSPAAQAGLMPHDSLLKVDGGAIRDENGVSRTLGKEGTLVTLTVQRPGEAPHDVTVTRQRVSGELPIDYCIVPNTHIGYILLPTLLDKTMADQTRAALQAMTAVAPLNGLVLDNRVNGGGLGSQATGILNLFADGLQGNFVSRDGKEPLQLQGEDMGGSQTVPLVVLVGLDTVSYGEIVSGVLRVANRATIMGIPTLGNVEQLKEYDFTDGSRAWIASATFQPNGQANGIWEETGIIPDVVVPSRWDLFTEATDPALAKAVELLTTK